MIGMLGFSGCEKYGAEEYGTPHVDYTLKGAVVNKANGKPIGGIRVGYLGHGCKDCVYPMYGTIPTPFAPKSHVMTNAKGEFILKDRFYDGEAQTFDNKTLVHVSVVDEKNGLFHPEFLQVDFSNAKQIGKPKGWSKGEFLITQSIGLTEIKS